MVRPDARGDSELELRRLLDPLARKVGRPERLGDHHVGVGQLALEKRIRAVLVGSDDELMPLAREPVAKAERARDAAQQLPRTKVDRARRRQRLPVGIILDPRQAVARPLLGIAGLRIVVEDAQYLGHLPLPFSRHDRAAGSSGAAPARRHPDPRRLRARYK
jgi:hypothetical protein